MRVGVLSDVHGNLPALDVALGLLQEHGADHIVSAGDAVGYGPHPAQCVDRLREIEAFAVAGNHELFLLDRLAPDRFSERALQSLAWSRTALGPERLAWLGRLPERRSLGPVVVTHASLDDPEEYVVRPAQAHRQLQLLARTDPTAQLLVLGHTHQPLWVAEGRRPRVMTRGGSRPLSSTRTLVNPGSVGQSRQRERTPRARFALVDVDGRRVRWFAVDYDRSVVTRDAAIHHLPGDSLHLRPARGRALARTVRMRTDLSLRRSGRSTKIPTGT